MKVDGTIDKCKAKLVVKGFMKKHSVNYFDTYSPVAEIASIQVLLTLVSIQNLVIHQIDVKIAFSK